MSKEKKSQGKGKSLAELGGERSPTATSGPTRSSSGSSAPSKAILPLPKKAAEVARARWQVAHPGLAFNKLLAQWPPGWDLTGEHKRALLQEFAKAFSDHPGKELFKAFVARRRAFLERLGNQGCYVLDRLSLKTHWRLVSGLGIAHPFETGYVFDRTYGVPYLPGSSIKGAARAWAEERRNNGDPCWGSTQNDDTVLDAVFGPELSEQRTGAFTPAQGAVIFFDAYPSAWPKLEVDVLNPHYKEYYEGKKLKDPATGQERPMPPADWLSPVPIYFLTVGPGQTFEFAVAVKKPVPQKTLEAARVSDAADLARKALLAVQGAAQELGLGGKTAVGYGYFTASKQPSR
jgi:CRISPR-associated protein Cmr6